MIIFFNICNGQIISRTALTEVCFRKNGKIDCSWNFVETLLWWIIMKDNQLYLKIIKIKYWDKLIWHQKGFKMKCEPIIEKYLRSYEVKIQTVKSCPGTGSCHHDNCLIVNNN